MIPQRDESDIPAAGFREGKHQHRPRIQGAFFEAIDQHHRVGEILAIGSLNHQVVGNPVIASNVPRRGPPRIDRQEIDLVDR